MPPPQRASPIAVQQEYIVWIGVDREASLQQLPALAGMQVHDYDPAFAGICQVGDPLDAITSEKIIPARWHSFWDLHSKQRQ